MSLRQYMLLNLLIARLHCEQESIKVVKIEEYNN